MPHLLNRMVILQPLDFHKDITTIWIAPGSSRYPMEKSLKSELHLLTFNLTCLILFARKEPNGNDIVLKFVAFNILTKYHSFNLCMTL